MPKKFYSLGKDFGRNKDENGYIFKIWSCHVIKWLALVTVLNQNCNINTPAAS